MAQDPRTNPTIHLTSHGTPDPRSFGVYLHTNLSDPTGVSATLVAQGPDFNSAYVSLIQHAGELIGNRPDWGATQQGTKNHVYEVSTRGRELVMRYSIELLREEYEADGPPLRQPPVHYGMYVQVQRSESEQDKFFLSGFDTLGEASHAMKISAAAYMAQHASATLMERSVELLDEKGTVRQRYEVVKGRKIRGKFMKEQDWMNDEREGEEPGLAQEQKKKMKMKEDIAKPKSILRAATTPTSSDPMHFAPPALPTPPQIEPPTASSSPIITPPVPSPSQIQLPIPPPVPELWCTCRAPDNGRLMVACDNDNCPVEWYHPVCLGLAHAPEGDWLCPTCAPRKAGKGRRTGTRRGTPGAKKKKAGRKTG